MVTMDTPQGMPHYVPPGHVIMCQLVRAMRELATEHGIAVLVSRS